MSSELGALLVARRLCLPCLAAKSGLAPHAARVRVDRVAALILVRELDALCEACRRVTTTYGID